MVNVDNSFKTWLWKVVWLAISQNHMYVGDDPVFVAAGYLLMFDDRNVAPDQWCICV